MPYMKDLSYEDRLKKLKLPTLVFMFLRGDMIEKFKIMNGLYDFTANKLLSLFGEHVPLNKRNQGHGKELFTKYARLDLRKKSQTHGTSYQKT